DLGELSVNGDVGGTARIEGFGERAPIIRIGDDLVVVAAIKQYVALGMPDRVELGWNLYLAARTVLNDGFVQVERTGSEHIKLHFLGGSAATRRWSLLRQQSMIVRQGASPNLGAFRPPYRILVIENRNWKTRIPANQHEPAGL